MTEKIPIKNTHLVNNIVTLFNTGRTFQQIPGVALSFPIQVFHELVFGRAEKCVHVYSSQIERVAVNS